MKSSFRWLIVISGLILITGSILTFSRFHSLDIDVLGAPAAVKAQGPTVIHINDKVLHDHVLRMGVNLGGENSYDSGQILRNLVSRNPGFEGTEWQSVLQCKRVASNTCTDGTDSNVWPAGFLDGGTFEVILGKDKGRTGTIVHSTAADKSAHSGVTIQVSSQAGSLDTSDYIVVRKQTSGGMPLGWALYGGAIVTAESDDLPPSSPGKQALRMVAKGPNEFGAVTQYFDSLGSNSFVKFRGRYVIRFKAKGRGALGVNLRRIEGDAHLFDGKVDLSNSWKAYELPFLAAETSPSPATLSLGFSVYGNEAIIDDVSVSAAGSNGTAFRDEVVETLQRLHPVVLRYMDSGQNFGSSLDNLLAVEFGRKPTGFSMNATDPQDMPIGLHDFLVLCEKIGAEPWYTMQIGTTEQQSRDLLEYLGGPASSKYGAVRVALGHPAPWTDVFPRIHLEYGNESWNAAQSGAVIPDAVLYAQRASTIFRAMRSSNLYSPNHYDLIANGWVISTDWNRKVIEAGDGFDTIDIAPYTFNTFSDDSSLENIFGPMLAQPEMMDSSPKGSVRQQSDVAAHAKHPVNLAVYETSIDTRQGTVGQASLTSTVPSIGAGLAAIDHMLLMLRDLGVTLQNTFQLAGYRFSYVNTSTYKFDEMSPIWGVVVDMGGSTNRVRPSFLAEQLANEAIKSNMLETYITGEDPTWDQPLSANDKVQLNGAHELQSFAFTDGKSDTLILLNLSRSVTRSVLLAGDHAPSGTVKLQTLTSGKICDNNEMSEQVKVVTQTLNGVDLEKTAISLAPFSMTVLSSLHQ